MSSLDYNYSIFKVVGLYDVLSRDLDDHVLRKSTSTVEVEACTRVFSHTHNNFNLCSTIKT